MTSADDATPVWPDPEGTVRGEAWAPLYPKAVDDRMTKRLVYAEAGVTELWTIVVDDALERWCGERLSEREVPMRPAVFLTRANVTRDSAGKRQER